MAKFDTYQVKIQKPKKLLLASLHDNLCDRRVCLAAKPNDATAEGGGGGVRLGNPLLLFIALIRKTGEEWMPGNLCFR